MELNADAIDTLVYEIVRDWEAVRGDCRSPLGREEICQSVLEHLKKHIAQYVLLSLQRLAEKGAIIEDRDVNQGRPYRYWLP